MSQNSPLYEPADRARLLGICRNDLAVLEELERLSEPTMFRAHRLSQVRTFLRVLERRRPLLPYTHVACMVCERYDEAYWRAASEQNRHRGMHCAAHAEAFHAVAPAAWNCCDPPYHPARDYAWRAAAPGVMAPLAVFELAWELQELSDAAHSQASAPTAAVTPVFSQQSAADSDQ